MKDKRFVASAYATEKQFTIPYDMRGYGKTENEAIKQLKEKTKGFWHVGTVAVRTIAYWLTFYIVGVAHKANS